MCAKRDQSRERTRSKTDVLREGPTRIAPTDRERSASYEDIADIVGSDYLKAWGYGRKRHR
jgi:hypothetical protein